MMAATGSPPDIPSPREPGIPAKKITAAVLLALICLPGIVFNVGLAVSSAIGGGIDFNEFYSAARLAGTGRLYDMGALWPLELEHGGTNPCAMIPAVAYGLKPITALPYTTARYVWLAASVAALLAFGALWPGVDRRAMWVLLAWSLPAGYLLLLGQTTPFWLMFFAAALVLAESGHPRLAGLAFALCLCKYHLAVGIPVLLGARRLWSTMAAGALAVTAFVAVSFPIEGLGWPRAYAAMFNRPDFSPGAGRMPNLHGLASWLPGSTAIEAAASILTIALLWRFCRDANGVGIAGAAAAACGLILGRHGYPNDCALLIPLAAFSVRDATKPFWFRGWALALTPVLAVLMLYGPSAGIPLVCVGFVIAALLLR